MFCMNCGQQLPDAARFCSKCGTATRIDDSAEISEETPQQAPEVSTRAVTLHTSPGQALQPQVYEGEVVSEREMKPYSQESHAKEDVFENSPFSSQDRDEKIRSMLEEVHKVGRTDLRKAISLCIEALKLDKNNSEIYYTFGQILEKSGRYQEALETFEHAIRIGTMLTSPFNVKACALGKKAEMLHRLHRDEEALSAVEEAMRLGFQHYSLYYVQSEVLCNLNRYDQAHSAFARYQSLFNAEINRHNL
jgi:tetratricopeptide (TPR) repeat protein